MSAFGHGHYRPLLADCVIRNRLLATRSCLLGRVKRTFVDFSARL